jgi:hypothetical protein
MHAAQPVRELADCCDINKLTAASSPNFLHRVFLWCIEYYDLLYYTGKYVKVKLRFYIMASYFRERKISYPGNIIAEINLEIYDI